MQSDSIATKHLLLSVDSAAAGIADARLVEPIDDIHGEFSGYGYRRVTRELAARGYPVNRKHTARTCASTVWRDTTTIRAHNSQHDSPVFPNLYRNRIPLTP
jgi:putative transposase